MLTRKVLDDKISIYHSITYMQQWPLDLQFKYLQNGHSFPVIRLLENKNVTHLRNMNDSGDV